MERDHLTPEIAGEFRQQEAEQKQDAGLAEDRDRILEQELFELQRHFKNPGYYLATNPH